MVKVLRPLLRRGLSRFQLGGTLPQPLPALLQPGVLRLREISVLQIGSKLLDLGPQIVRGAVLRLLGPKAGPLPFQLGYIIGLELLKDRPGLDVVLRQLIELGPLLLAGGDWPPLRIVPERPGFPAGPPQ